MIRNPAVMVVIAATTTQLLLCLLCLALSSWSRFRPRWSSMGILQSASGAGIQREGVVCGVTIQCANGTQSSASIVPTNCALDDATMVTTVNRRGIRRLPRRYVEAKTLIFFFERPVWPGEWSPEPDRLPKGLQTRDHRHSANRLHSRDSGPDANRRHSLDASHSATSYSRDAGKLPSRFSEIHDCGPWTNVWELWLTHIHACTQNYIHTDRFSSVSCSFFSLMQIFIDADFHWSRFSSVHVFFRSLIWKCSFKIVRHVDLPQIFIDAKCSLKQIFIDADINWRRLSLKQILIDTDFNWRRFSLKQIFKCSCSFFFHWSVFSCKQIFIDADFHWSKF